MKYFFSALVVFLFLLSAAAYGLTARVTFTLPTNPTYLTDVLVSEVSGDFSQSYVYRSEPGAGSLLVDNIKPGTEYFFVAYRMIPDTWEKSPYSEEVAFTADADTEPVLRELPPLILGDVVVTVTVQQVN